MTLSDALVAVAPLDRTLSPEEQDRRNDAAAIVFAALSRLAPRVLRAEDRDVAVSDVLVRLAKNRPGARRYTSSDGEAEAYLMASLRNKLRDLHRERQKERARWVSTDPDEDGWAPHEAVDAETPEDLVLEREAHAGPHALLADAVHLLFTQAVPAIAAKVQNPEGFLENVRDLQAIANGDLTVDAIVEREGGHGAAFVKVRNRVYQRHKRTRGYLLEVPRNRPTDVPRLTEWLLDASLSPQLEAAVRQVASDVFTPRVVRGARSAEKEQAS